MNDISIIKGGIARDNRGEIRFVNDFDMSLIKRFYIIKNSDNELLRGWRAHKIEKRWFYVTKGTFEINVVNIDNFDCPSTDLLIESTIINELNQEVLYVPEGFGTTLRSLELNSQLLVFADYGIEHTLNDDYTYPLDYFIKRK